MEFTPGNPAVKRCIQGMALEEKGEHTEAAKLFIQAWNDATNDFERFIVAYHIARLQKDIHEKLKWFEKSLALALKINDNTVNSAYHVLYSNIAQCYKELNDSANEKKNQELATSFKDKVFDTGPFFHGTKADLKAGDLLVAGNRSNYQSDLIMNHIYFTAIAHGAGLAASLAKGDGRERVYVVEPNGSFENDPNVTDKKFPGNLTRSYRTREPLKIVGEINDWTKLTSDELQKWREKLENNKGEIIN